MTRQEILDEFDILHDKMISVARGIDTECAYVIVPFGVPVVRAKYSKQEDRFISLSYDVGVGKPSFSVGGAAYFDDTKEVIIDLKEVDK